MRERPGHRRASRGRAAPAGRRRDARRARPRRRARRAVQLARRYAKVIDEARDAAWAARWIGPLLLACLAELGATPAAKAALDKAAKTPPQGPNRLDQLRASRGSPDRGRGRL